MLSTSTQPHLHNLTIEHCDLIFKHFVSGRCRACEAPGQVTEAPPPPKSTGPGPREGAITRYLLMEKERFVGTCLNNGMAHLISF